MNVKLLNKMVQNWFEDQDNLPKGVCVEIKITSDQVAAKVESSTDVLDLPIARIFTWKNFEPHASRNTYTLVINNLGSKIRQITESEISHDRFCKISLRQFFEYFPNTVSLLKIPGMGRKCITAILAVLIDQGCEVSNYA